MVVHTAQICLPAGILTDILECMFESGSVVDAAAGRPEDLWAPPAETDAGWAELPELLPVWLLDTAGATGFWPDTDCACGAGQPTARPDPVGSAGSQGCAANGGAAVPAGTPVLADRDHLQGSTAVDG